MECYACDREATQRCSRCGNAYCSEHGGDPNAPGGQALCAECLDPVSATPSGTVFRASLFALLGTSILALWLLVRPPALPGESSKALVPAPTSSPNAPAGTAAPPTAAPGATAGATPAEATPPPAAPPAAPPPLQYVMQDGDTVSGVAAAHGIRYLDLLAFNNLSEDDATLLRPGDVILVPQ
jgi:LysM repeat protein